MKCMDFDYFFVKEVECWDNICFFDNIEIVIFKCIEIGWFVGIRFGDFMVYCCMLIVVNGVYFVFSCKEVGLEKDNKYYVVVVWAYYWNVKVLDKDNFIELYFIKFVILGYFWIFFLFNGEVNVGLGMCSDIFNCWKVNFWKEMLQLLEIYLVFKECFKDVELIGGIKGFGLFLGFKCCFIFGDYYMFVGDVGYLVDLFIGEGIGNVFYSGFIVVEQLE